MMANNGIRGWGPAIDGFRAQGREQGSEGSEVGRSNGSWWFGGGERNESENDSSRREGGSNKQTMTTPLLQQGEQGEQGGRYARQYTQQFPPHFTPVQQWIDQHTRQQFTPQVVAGTGIAMTPGMTAHLEQSPLYNRSTAISAIGQKRFTSPAVSEEDLKKAMRKALRREDVSFRSEEQGEALRTIVSGEQTTPLVVVLPTGGGKSLLFMAPACLDDPGVTIVVVPYRALLDNLVATAKKARIDYIEYRPGE